MSSILKIDKISKYYGNKSNLTKAIDSISLEVNKGEFIAIMGSSGSGKTTLLNSIATIDKVTSGHIFLENKDITKLKGNQLNKFRREELGFIFQDFNLLDTLTAYENIALALQIQNIKASEDIKRRLYDIGLIKDTKIKLLYVSPTKNIKAYLIRDSIIAIRNKDASLIKVVDIND